MVYSMTKQTAMLTT
ncbi:porphyromonas-type peptidyl-arginine deiminase family protein, partial [Vibrio parahaemolyticus V-223/04]